jgi:AraC-like DNA-binding protein
MTQFRSGSGLLHRYPQVHSRDPEVMLAALNAVYRTSEVIRSSCRPGPQTHEFRAFAGPGFAIGYIRSGMGVDIIPPAQGSPCYLNLTYSGTLRARSGSGELLNEPRLAAVLSTSAPQRLTPLAPDTATVGIKFDRDLLDAELAALLGRQPDAPVRFQLGLDLTTVAGRGIAGLVRGMLAEADRPEGGLFDHAAVRQHYVRTLLVALLTAHSHTYSDALTEPGSPPRPRSLRQALEFVEHHLATPMTVTDLAVAAGCSARTLHEQFHEHLGRSPMSHVKELRLQRAHRELRRTGRPVTEVAFECGFTHLGRFSSAYRARFGVLPSRTARGA